MGWLEIEPLHRIEDQLKDMEEADNRRHAELVRLLQDLIKEVKK